MPILEHLGEWLTAKDPLERSDAVVVLDGPEFDLRLATGLGLLIWGFAPRALVIQCSAHDAQHGQARDAARERANQVFLLPCAGASTREEAAAARPALQRWGCASVTVVTSWFHTRRARAVFSRELRKDGIRVSAYPVDGPDVERKSWWKSKQGRRAVPFEAAKLLATWLRLDLAMAPTRESTLKESFPPTTVPQSSPNEPPLPWARPQTTRTGATNMGEKSFRAINLTAPEGRGAAALTEAFNTWASQARPSAIVHVHFYHDESVRVCGYLIVFEEDRKAREFPATGTEERQVA